MRFVQVSLFGRARLRIVILDLRLVAGCRTEYANADRQAAAGIEQAGYILARGDSLCRGLVVALHEHAACDEHVGEADVERCPFDDHLVKRAYGLAAVRTGSGRQLGDAPRARRRSLGVLRFELDPAQLRHARNKHADVIHAARFEFSAGDHVRTDILIVFGPQDAVDVVVSYRQADRFIRSAQRGSFVRCRLDLHIQQADCAVEGQPCCRRLRSDGLLIAVFVQNGAVHRHVDHVDAFDRRFYAAEGHQVDAGDLFDCAYIEVYLDELARYDLADAQVAQVDIAAAQLLSGQIVRTEEQRDSEVFLFGFQKLLCCS